MFGWFGNASVPGVVWDVAALALVRALAFPMAMVLLLPEMRALMCFPLLQDMLVIMLLVVFSSARVSWRRIGVDVVAGNAAVVHIIVAATASGQARASVLL